MLEQYINSRKIIRRENKTLVLELLFSSLLPLCALSIIDRFASYKEGTQRSRHSNTKYIFPYFSRYNSYNFFNFLAIVRILHRYLLSYISLLYNYYIVKFVKITAAVLKSIAQTFGGIAKKRTITSNTQRAYKHFGGSFVRNDRT